MTSLETRNIPRDSLFLMAKLRVEGQTATYQVKVRNLSAGGMMAEGDVRVQCGMIVSVDLRNVGPVEGAVAWIQDNRFGIAFREEIDAKKVRAMPQTGNEFSEPRYTRNYQDSDPGKVRKI
jgi:hypothetical protein